MQGRKFFFYLWSIAFILPIFSLQAQGGNEEPSADYTDQSIIDEIVKRKERIPIQDRIANMTGRETRELAFYKLKQAQDNYQKIKKTTQTFFVQKTKAERNIERLKKSKNKDATKLQNLKEELKFLKSSEKYSEKLEKVAEKAVEERKQIVDAEDEKRKKMLIKLYPSLDRDFQPIRSMDSIVLEDKDKKKNTKSTEEKKESVENTITTIKEEQKEPKKVNVSPPAKETPKEKEIETTRPITKKEDNDKNKKPKESKISTDTDLTMEQKIDTKPSEATRKDISSNRPQKIFATYKISEDVSINPPTLPCSFAFSGEDELTGKVRKEVSPQLLFSHTDEAIRPYMNGREYLTCEAYLTLAGGFQFLTLNIAIASKNAQKEYGSINKGSILTIKTLDEKTVKLQATKSDTGKYNQAKDAFIYTVSYRIAGSATKQLKKSEIDFIRLVWSSGYVDYNIYEVDFFIHQFNCLAK